MFKMTSIVLSNFAKMQLQNICLFIFMILISFLPGQTTMLWIYASLKNKIAWKHITKLELD